MSDGHRKLNADGYRSIDVDGNRILGSAGDPCCCTPPCAGCTIPPPLLVRITIAGVTMCTSTSGGPDCYLAGRTGGGWYAIRFTGDINGVFDLTLGDDGFGGCIWTGTIPITITVWAGPTLGSRPAGEYCSHDEDILVVQTYAIVELRPSGLVVYTRVFVPNPGTAGDYLMGLFESGTSFCTGATLPEVTANVIVSCNISEVSNLEDFGAYGGTVSIDIP